MPQPQVSIQDSLSLQNTAKLWFNRNQYFQSVRYFKQTTGASEELFIDGITNNRLTIPADSSVLVVCMYSCYNDTTASKAAGGIVATSVRNTSGTATAITNVQVMALTGDGTPGITAPVIGASGASATITAGTAATILNWECIVYVVAATSPESNFGSVT